MNNLSIHRFCAYRAIEGCAEGYKECTSCFKEAFNGDGYSVFPFDKAHFEFEQKSFYIDVKRCYYGFGNPKFGAPHDKIVFIIELEKRNFLQYKRLWK